MALVRRFCGLIGLSLALAGCSAEKPEPEPVPAAECDCPAQTDDARPEAERFRRVSVEMSDLPQWNETDLRPSLLAFQKQCELWARRSPEDPISKSALYGGTVQDWLPACKVLPKYLDALEYHRFYEDYFDAYELVTDESINKLTGYCEPELLVSDRKTEAFSAPIPLRPKDLIEVRLGQFDPALEGKTVWGRVEGTNLVLYPPRADISITSDRVLAWADPADVFFLQIQGSGRLKYENGRVVRAGFDSHNHRPFGSLANHLIKTGEIERSNAGMKGIRDWIASVSDDRAKTAMNVNPRFVFFRERPMTSPDEGPVGAAGLPLVPLGSVAVDLDVHPLGVPMYVESAIPSDQNSPVTTQTLLLIAQDTGGAIKGVRRGDIFFGWGDAAGARAGRMNAEGRFFVFLPQDLTAGPDE